MSAIAEALAGCDGTVTGWHVPAFNRGLRLVREEEATTEPLYLLGVRVDVVVRYRFNLRPDKAICLCGWRPTEAAVLAIEGMVQDYLDAGGDPTCIVDVLTGRALPAAKRPRRRRLL